MDFTYTCTKLTGFFPSKSVGAFKITYERVWALLLIFAPIVSLIGVILLKSHKLVDIVSAIQGPALTFRWSFCALYFWLCKARYVEILDERIELTRWMKMLVLKSDASAAILRPKRANTCAAIKFFYFPYFISLFSQFSIIFLPLLFVTSNEMPTSVLNNGNSSNITQKNDTHAPVIAIQRYILISVSFILISLLGLKRRCIDLLIFKLYSHVIEETNFLTAALKAAFSEKRAFFHKVNLTNWIKCKERLMR